MGQDTEEEQSAKDQKTSGSISCQGTLQLAFEDREIEQQYYFRNMFSLIMVGHIFQARNWDICLTDMYKIVEIMGHIYQEKKNHKNTDTQEAMQVIVKNS